MESKWKHLKEKALNLRRQGISMTEIEHDLGIARSTLSHWFRDVKLNNRAVALLRTKKRVALEKARVSAVAWHNRERIKRLKVAESSALSVLSKINQADQNTLEIALAMLYFGEGAKTGTLGIGNSDPLILRFFLDSVRRLYGLDKNGMSFNLHLRADQDPSVLVLYWARKLGISPARFGASSIDKRTIGKPTYSDYKGVCTVSCGNVAIQRKLVYLSRAFCERAIEKEVSTRG